MRYRVTVMDSPVPPLVASPVLPAALPGWTLPGGHEPDAPAAAFAAGIDACPDPEAREIFGLVCDLYALSVIDADKAWYIEHRFLSMDRAKAVTAGINDRCRKLRPYAEVLVDGFGIPEQLRYAEMLHPERIPDI